MTGEQEEQASSTVTSAVVQEMEQVDISEVNESVGAANQNPPTEVDSTSPAISKIELEEKACSALQHGKRDLLIKDLNAATVSLSDACRLYSEVKGTFSPESSEAHYYYGKALLEQARSELSVLPEESVAHEEEDDEDEDDGEENEKEKENEEDDDEEKKEADDDDDKMEVDSEATAITVEEDLNVSSPADTSTENLATSEENGETTTTESTTVMANRNGHHSSNDNGQVDEEGKPSSSEGEVNISTEGGEEEPTNLELAWEVFEISKVGYQKQLEAIHGKLDSILKLEEPDATLIESVKTEKLQLKRRLADTHLLLGDVATESEQYTQAVEDYRTALIILREIKERDDSREVAHCYFQLGLAYSFDKKFVESIESFQKAVCLIKSRMGNLQLMIETKTTAKDKGISNPNYTEEKEIEELQTLLPELEEKVSDTVDAQKESVKTQAEEAVEKEILTRNSPVKNPNPPVANDISHLVRKKKKLDEDEVAQTQPPAKKHCVGNGHAVPADTTNDEHTKEQANP